MLNRLDYTINDVDSIVHRINPVIKFIGLIIYVLICLLKYNNLLFILNIGFVFLLMLLSNVKYIRYLKVIWNLKYLIIIYYLFCLNTLELEFSNVNILLFKILFFIFYIKVIELTTSKECIGKGLSAIINIFNLIGISIRKIELFFVNIITYLILLITNHNKVIDSLEYKGINYSHTNIIDKWKVSISNMNNVLSNSKSDMKKRKRDIDSKNYNSKVKRVYKYRNSLVIFDIIYLVYNIGLLVFYVLVVR